MSCKQLLEMGSWKGVPIHSGRSIFAVLVMFSTVSVVAYQVFLMSNQSTKLSLTLPIHVERTQHILRKSETIWVNVGRSIKLLQAPAESSQFVRDQSEKVSLNMANQPPRVAESNQFMRDSETVSLNMINQPPRVAESNQFMRDSEKVSLNMTNHKHLKSPRPAEKNQFMRESGTVWVNVGPKIFVFSAYLDTRESYYYRKHGVVALAVQNIQMSMLSLYCLLTDSNERSFCLKNAVRKVSISSKQFQYRQYYYICNLPPRFSAITLKFVSFSFDRSCQQPSPPIPVSQVQTTSNPTKRFGVCIESPLFNMTDVQFIIQTIEMNRILGAEWFTFYVHSASQDVMRVLQDYSKEGVVEVVMSTVPNISVHYYGQSTLLQDCAYRNMYKVGHLFYTDLDEIIVPQKDQNWSQMITAMDRKSIGSFHVRHVAFSGESAPKMLSICNSTREIEVPRFMKFMEHSPPYPLTQRTKYIIKPETFSVVAAHVPSQLLKGYSTYTVPSDVALLYHYRLPFLSDGPGKQVKDDRMIRYLPELIEHIEQRIC